MKIELESKVLQAALHCAATKDIRYYLQGVHIKFFSKLQFTASGTNGHILFAGVGQALEIDDPVDATGLSLIIPYDVVKKLAKNKAFVYFETLGDNRYILDDQIFTAVDGTYPDISRVIPPVIDSAQTPSTFNPEYLVKAQKALNTYYGNKPTTSYLLHQRGDDSAIMHAGGNNAQVIVMPIRGHVLAGHDSIQPFNRDYL